MNRQGTGIQPLRGLSGFPGQQPAQNRNTPLGSGRLQNGKIANTSSWGFGIPTGAPGLPNPQGRTPGGASTSFAQTIGSSQPATPLDLSEFPSLSGTQPQFQNPSQAVWANATQRATQQTPVQRPQQSQPSVPATAPVQQQVHHAQDQSQQSLDEAFFASQYNGGLDDYRHGGQSGVGQLPGSQEPQATSIDEFPPLGRNGHGEIGQDRRGNLMHNASAGGSLAAFAALNTGPSLLNRTPGEAFRQSQTNTAEQNKNPVNHYTHIFADLDAPMTIKPESFIGQQQQAASMQAPGSSTRGQQFQSGFSGDSEESPGATTQTRTKTPLSEMAPIDRWGLAGLVETISNADPDISGLAQGQDLTTLGLNLNSQEPLYPTWTGPFNNFAPRPLQPEFVLPQCYTVHNVHKLEEKVSSFSDETLFYMFYTMPRDIMQEVAAIELTGRNWRYHKERMQWLTKNPSYPEPLAINHEAERGNYVVFNHKEWRRESTELILRWADLDTHITNRQNGGGLA